MPISRGWCAVGVAAWLLGCGSADHSVAPEPEGAGAATADVNSSVNVCPLFTGSLVMPQRIAPGEASTIIVRATDLDAPDSELVFAWSAASGAFDPRDKPMTSYRCDALGTEQLTLSAKDSRGCVSDMKIEVECVAN
jgi:hypothetical protein